MVDEGESVAAGTQARVALNEIVFREIQKSRYRCDVGVREFNEPRPAATIRAALAGIAWRVAH